MEPFIKVLLSCMIDSENMQLENRRYFVLLGINEAITSADFSP